MRKAIYLSLIIGCASSPALSVPQCDIKECSCLEKTFDSLTIEYGLKRKQAMADSIDCTPISGEPTLKYCSGSPKNAGSRVVSELLSKETQIFKLHTDSRNRAGLSECKKPEISYGTTQTIDNIREIQETLELLNSLGDLKTLEY